MLGNEFWRKSVKRPPPLDGCAKSKKKRKNDTNSPKCELTAALADASGLDEMENSSF